MRLIADLLAMQDPDKPHTLLTRAIVSLIIVFASLVYAGLFGIFGAIGVYLLGVELMSMELQWALVPIGLALAIGLYSSLGSLKDYWQNYGHG